MAITTAQIQQLYVAYLGRAADKAGLDYWSQQLNAEKPVLTLENLRANFVNEQPEYVNAYAGLSRSDTVVKIYNNLFGRAPDAEGLAYWTTGGGATVNADQLLTAFVAGAGADDAKIIANKVLVAEVYTSTAGTNYAAADAKSIIADVGSDGTSVGTALNKLTDGSLSGIAIPAALANLKAATAADAAVTGFETTKAASLLAIENKLVTLSKSDANIKDQSTTATSATKYDALDTELKADLGGARTALGTTKSLADAATATAEDLIAARTTLTAVDKQSVDHVTAYTKALAAVAANPVVSGTDQKQAVDTLTAFGNNSSNTAAWDKALADAGITKGADAAATALKVYNALTDATASDASISTIKAAFASVTNFNSVVTTADKDLAAEKAALALTTAAKPLNELKDASGVESTAGADWIKALGDDTTAQSKLASSKALGALEAEYKTVADAYKASTDAQGLANGKLDAGDKLIDTAGVLSVKTTPDDTKAEVFYFAKGNVTSADGTLKLAAGGDSIYLGDGYSLNKTATLGATGITGADNNSKEVFFFKAADNSIKAVIETSVIGSTTVADNNFVDNKLDGVAVITLSGVTSIDQVTFANGVISHVA